MTAPKHQPPTAWGNFLIEPVATPLSGKPGEGIDNRPDPRPRFDASAKTTGNLDGPESPQNAKSRVSRFVPLPAAVEASARARGMTPIAASAVEQSGAFTSSVLYGRTSPANAMIELSAYTPSAPVIIPEYPANAIYDFDNSTEINGNPTLTRFPHLGTSDPNGERTVMWSQGSVVYFLRTIGSFTNEEILNWAREISSQEVGR